MIFAPEMVKAIQASKKTQTRRVVKSKICRYRQGRSYSIQSGRGRAGTGRLTVTEEPRQERLIDISLLDARREGFRTRRDFFDYWVQLHGVIKEQQLVWVLTFEKGDKRDQPRLLRGSSPNAPICQAVLKAPDPRAGKVCGRAFADKDYLTGKPVTVCVCGSPRPPESEEDHGYTSRRSSAMRGEGEAIPVKLQERYAEKAAEESAAKRAEQRKRLAQTVAGIRAQAAQIPREQLDPQTRKSLKSAEHHLQATEQKLGDSAEVAA